MRILKTENRKISVNELKISNAYQRTIVPARVSKIAKHLDQDAFGSLTVGQRGDGSLWVVDGMQRLTAARRLGIIMVPCDVFSSDGPEHEARVFRLKNKERTNVCANALFRAQLVEGDPQSVDIAKAVREAGLKIMFTKSGNAGWPYIKAVKSLERSFQRVGKEGLSMAFRILCEVWPGEVEALHGDMIEGMCWFIKRHADFDPDRMVAKLRTKAVSSVIRAADANYRLGRERDSSYYGRSNATYDALAIIYNKGLHRKNRVKAAEVLA